MDAFTNINFVFKKSFMQLSITILSHIEKSSQTAESVERLNRLIFRILQIE